MTIDKEKLKLYGLEKFKNDIENIETQYLNLIYDPNFDHVVDRRTYDKTKNLMKWRCAICGAELLVDKNREDVENFVCEKCKETYNNKNMLIDKRIMDSRTKMFKYIENKLYESLEDILKGSGL